MTGRWQVLGPARPSLAEMVKTDYLYAVYWSMWTDVKIPAAGAVSRRSAARALTPAIQNAREPTHARLIGRRR